MLLILIILIELNYKSIIIIISLGKFDYEICIFKVVYIDGFYISIFWFIDFLVKNLIGGMSSKILKCIL